MKSAKLASAVLVFALGWPVSDVAAAGGEITLLTGQESGDYGTGSDTERQSATARFTYGDTLRFRLDLEMVRVNSDLGVAQTPFGPVPTRGPKGPRGGTGVAGPGQGSPTGAGTPTLPSDTSTPTRSATDWTSGLGDPRLTLSRQIAGGGAKLYRVDVEVGAKLPTADEEEHLGTGELDHRLGLAGQYRFWSMTAFGGLGWNTLGDPDWVELNDVLDAYIGLESQPLAEKVVVSGWLEGNEEVVAGTGSRSALGVGVSSTGKMRWRAQVRTGLSGSAEDLSALFGVSFGVSTPSIGSRKVG